MVMADAEAPLRLVGAVEAYLTERSDDAWWRVVRAATWLTNTDAPEADGITVLLEALRRGDELTEEDMTTLAFYELALQQRAGKQRVEEEPPPDVVDEESVDWEPPGGWENFKDPLVEEPATKRVNGAVAQKAVDPRTGVDLQVLRPFQRVNVDLTVALPPTPLLTPWLYGGGCLTVLQSEPGVGKSWLALWLSVMVMEAGLDVVYIDEEGGLELVHERLRLLGAKPELVAERFWYFAFETRTWGEEDMLALNAMLATVPRPGLAVLDSLPDFLAVAGQDEDRAKDVTAFIKKVCGAFREIGCSQLVLDHLPKPPAGSKKERSRYSRGSGSKLGKADATLLLEAEAEFDIRTNGTLRLWKTKDRRGRLPLPALGKPGVQLGVVVDQGEALEITEVVSANTAEQWDGPTECMAVVLEVLRSAPSVEFSKGKLVDTLRAQNHPFRNTTIHEAAERLALQGKVSHRRGPRNSDLFTWRPEGQTGAVELPEEPF